MAEVTNGRRVVTIDPVTRIEGHAKITLHLDEAGRLAEARFHVTEFRGFERFCVGRSFQEMPAITSRICGICPVSHLLASAKTGDALLAVTIPPTAANLRRIMNLGQVLQSHALSYFHLSGPDLYLGFGSDPKDRNIFGLIRQNPELARRGIRVRQIGQQVIEILGGRRIHSTWAAPGGVTEPLTREKRDTMLGWIPDGVAILREVLDDFKKRLPGFAEEIANYGDFPSLFLGTVTADGTIEHYDGQLRVVDAERNILVADLDPARYDEYFAEEVKPWSYLKFPYYRPLGFPAGIYRVGPLARLNIAERMGTPHADREFTEFRASSPRAVCSSFHFHWARLIEMLYALERIEQLLLDDQILDPRVKAEAGINRNEAVGFSEAPRGTLFHHYRVDDHGVLTWVNLIIATGQNNLGMNRAIQQIAEHYLPNLALTDEALNRIESGIRAFDPCLSCSTHAAGRMPMVVQVVSVDGRIVDERHRDSE